MFPSFDVIIDKGPGVMLLVMSAVFLCVATAVVVEFVKGLKPQHVEDHKNS